MRVGIGYDLHRIVAKPEGGEIWLGGISIPAPFGLVAHSDGDVLLHALTDACLGALALGDIGQWFSDSDPANRGRKSEDFFKSALKEISRLGWVLAQIDSIILLESPKLAPYIDDIRRQIATLAQMEISDVSVKAKTKEGLGPVGTHQAIEAHTIVTLKCR